MVVGGRRVVVVRVAAVAAVGRGEVVRVSGGGTRGGGGGRGGRGGGGGFGHRGLLVYL